MQIYNSLTKQKEDFVPLEGVRVNMYSCGVTVYDKCHIGHARSLYIFDVIRRYLKFRGFDVRFVRNITDVDDKIINKANQTGKSFADVVKENIDLYEQDLNKMQIGRADMEPRATENIPEMIGHIKELIAKGFAYESGGDVYFRVRAFKDYGKLSGQSVENMLEGVRIDPGERKEDPLDFALWKRSKPGEPAWESPWGEGRPGWHIECSVMSMRFLGCKTLDIHAGGRDLIFPHHENEIAQSEALTGQPFAKYWIHHGLLKINGQKMAKSLGNFITIEEAVNKYGADNIKMFFLSSHYSSEIDYSEHNIQDAVSKMDRLINCIENVDKEFGEEGRDTDVLEYFEKEFCRAMDDDFNTPKALGVLFELVKEANKFPATRFNTEAARLLIRLCAEIFGIDLMRKKDLSEEESRLLREREEARARKDFHLSDELRDRLKALGILVKDSKQGQEWHRISS
jgi:cysteinyl-tRNA synthetase